MPVPGTQRNCRSLAVTSALDAPITQRVPSSHDFGAELRDLPNERIVEPFSIRIDQPDGRMRRMARRRGQPKRIVKLEVVVHQQRLTGVNDRLAVEPPDIAGGIDRKSVV